MKSKSRLIIKGSTIEYASTLIVSTVCACLLAGQALPQEVTQSFPRGTPSVNKVMIQDSYYFTISHYIPRVKVKIEGHQQASYSTPEDAAVALISSISTGDFMWWRSIWDPESRALLQKRDEELHQSPDFWVQKWHESLSDKTPYLNARIETGQYVIVDYAFVNTSKDTDSVELATAFRKEGSKWMATQDLSNDPVLLYWKNPGVQIERMMRPPSNNGPQRTAQ